MSENTLAVIRDRVETLATEDGTYVVRCGRTGARPVPVEGCRFPDRETAAEAAQTAAAYRAVLRQYDSRAPVYDFIVCEGLPSTNCSESTDLTDTAPSTCDEGEGSV